MDRSKWWRREKVVKVRHEQNKKVKETEQTRKGRDKVVERGEVSSIRGKEGSNGEKEN